MKADFKKIQYFLKVAETLNFSNAAQELFISPQALNKQILKLEDELGVLLFSRTTRNVKLTESGKELQANFIPVQEQYIMACNKMDAYEDMQNKTIRIGFFQALQKKEVIYPIVKYLQSMNLGYHIEPIAGEIDEVNEWLRSGKTDMSITNIHEYEHWDNMKLMPFATTPAKVVVSLAHPWADRETLSVDDLNSMPFLLLARTKQLEADSFYSKIRGKSRIIAPNFNSMLTFLEADHYYAVMPKLFENMNFSGLRFIDLPKESVFNFSLVVMYPQNSKWKNTFQKLQSLADSEQLQL